MLWVVLTISSRWPPFQCDSPVAGRAAPEWLGVRRHSLGVVLLALAAIVFKDLDPRRKRCRHGLNSSWGLLDWWWVALAVRTAFGLELHSHDDHHHGAFGLASPPPPASCVARATIAATPMPPQVLAFSMAWRVRGICWP